MADASWTIRDRFRQENRGKPKLDPTTELNFIPSCDSKFLYLLGLEEVVQFRLELVDQTVYSVPKTRNTRGSTKKKKSPEPAVALYAPPKDAPVCAQCSIAFSCLWNQGTHGSCLCQSCFKHNWRKEHWSTSTPTETSIKFTSVSPSPAPLIQSVKDDHWDKDEGADYQNRDRLIARVSAFHMSPSNTSSSPSSSPSFYCDSSSDVHSPLSSDLLLSPTYYSTPSSTSELSEDFSSPLSLSSPDLRSSSSSSSRSPPPSLYLSKRAGKPYWVETPLPGSLLKEDKVQQEKNKEKKKYWNIPPHIQEKAEKTSFCGSLSTTSSSLTLASKRHNLQKAQAPNHGTVVSPGSSFNPVFSASKQRFETLKLMPNLKEKTKVEHTDQELKVDQSKFQKASLNSSIVTSAALGSPSTSSRSPKLTFHHMSSISETITGSVEGREQAFVSKSSRKSSRKTDSLISPKNVASAHQRKTSQQALPQKVSVCASDSSINKALPKEQKIDKWIRKQSFSIGSHSPALSISPASVSGRPEVAQEVLHLKKKKVDHRRGSSSTPHKSA